MTDKRCGKKWPAHLCAPGSLHQCTRPADHEGQHACKCGTWHSSSEASETGQRVRSIEEWAAARG